MFLSNEQITGIFKNFQPANEQLANAFKNMFLVNGQSPAASQNMFSGNEQLTNAIKTSLESQVLFFSAVTASALTSMEKLVELNMSAARVSMEESTVIVKQLLASKDSQEVQALLTALPQPTSAKAVAYGRHLTDIASAAQGEFTRAAEQHFAETGRKLSALVDQVSKNLPTGSGDFLAMAKSAVPNASAGYEQLNKKSQQAVEAVGAQASNAADKVPQVAGQVPGTTTRVQ
jgi:phasin family protein